MQRVILASGSKQRKLLMDALGISYEIIPADIDEKSIRSDDLAIQAEAIAKAKAEKVASENEGVIIAADVFGVVNGNVLEKPEDLEEAKEMLRLMSGNTLTAYCGVCYLDKDKNIEHAECVISDGTFRQFSDDEIQAYVEAFPVTTWAAAFSPAYAYGMTMVSSLSGSFTGFVHGLPMEVVVPLLKQSGFNPNPQK